MNTRHPICTEAQPSKLQDLESYVGRLRSQIEHENAQQNQLFASDRLAKSRFRSGIKSHRDRRINALQVKLDKAIRRLKGASVLDRREVVEKLSERVDPA